ncbi:hypothetical protein J2W34_006331 [Variovorax boronicumulans]|uniref:hypothetical protein n=1 Tax=Variovorax boronicumulans TaxID=436515 RepID=UPI002780B7DB|nr:hypothetical protein [Variovorax boronicumulans]MDQ0074507.1 hypothetical protein [Variovorax boronicumulans]
MPKEFAGDTAAIDVEIARTAQMILLSECAFLFSIDDFCPAQQLPESVPLESRGRRSFIHGEVNPENM